MLRALTNRPSYQLSTLVCTILLHFYRKRREKGERESEEERKPPKAIIYCSILSRSVKQCGVFLWEKMKRTPHSALSVLPFTSHMYIVEFGNKKCT